MIIISFYIIRAESPFYHSFAPSPPPLPRIAPSGVTVTYICETNPKMQHPQEALDTLADVGYTHVSLFLNRERQEIDLQEARQSLRKGWGLW